MACAIPDDCPMCRADDRAALRQEIATLTARNAAYERALRKALAWHEAIEGCRSRGCWCEPFYDEDEKLREPLLSESLPLCKGCNGPAHANGLPCDRFGNGDGALAGVVAVPESLPPSSEKAGNENA